MTGDKPNFQYILRLLNTNVDGKQKIMVALTEIKGVGRRYSNLVCKKADVDLTKRYAPLTIYIYIYIYKTNHNPNLQQNLTSIFQYIEPENSQPKNSKES